MLLIEIVWFKENNEFISLQSNCILSF